MTQRDSNADHWPWHMLGIIAILWLAMALRFVDLERVPPALNVDEALNGYEAYSLLETGRDEWGTPWPVTIRAFNDYRRPAIVYSAIPFVAAFGLTTFAIRATAATWGVLTVLLTYRLASDMFGTKTGLVAGFMLAVSPWHLHFSRSGREASLAMFTIVAGGWCLWRWLKGGRAGWLLGTGVFFGLSLYTYNITLAFVPLALAGCGVMFARRFWQHKGTASLMLGLLLLIAAPLIHALFFQGQTHRLNAVFLLGQDKPLFATVAEVFTQWAGHFGPNYLFFQGDAHKVLHPPGSGQLYLIDMLLLPLGSLAVLSKKDRRAGLWLLGWIALGAVPAALTVQEVGTPHSLRGMLGVPAFAILAARGVKTIWAYRRVDVRLRATLLVAVTAVLLWNVGTFVHRYFNVYPVQAARAHEYGMKEVVEYVTAHQDQYDTVVLTDWISQPHIFVLFFQRYDPHRFQTDPAVDYGQDLSVKLSRWDKYIVGNVEEWYQRLDHGLFVARPHMLPGVQPTKTVYHPDGSPAFTVFAK